MSDITITSPTLRVKITGRCNRTCNFCHEEGDMRGILPVTPDPEFFDCVHTLCDKLNMRKVMLSGGEPTVHPQLEEIFTGIHTDEISITTNGIKLLNTQDWLHLKNAGLNKLVISIHDSDPQKLIQLERNPRTLPWGRRSLGNQLANLKNACAVGITTRVNTVVYDQAETSRQVIASLEDLHNNGYKFEIRLLNDLSQTELSQQQIEKIHLLLQSNSDGGYRRAGTSNLTKHFTTPSGLRYSAKISFPYFFDPVCGGCAIQKDCKEGFYGLRLEKRQDDYYVRLCIYKQTRQVLMPWHEFLASDLARQIRLQFEQELHD